MKMQRRIISDQYGLVWFGAIMTFRHLGLAVAARPGRPLFQWGRKRYSLTGKYDKIDRFYDGLLQFSAEHPRPQIGCALGDIEEYCHRLLNKLADILQLGKTAREKYVGPHGFRKYFLRLETLTESISLDEYYSTLDESTNNTSMDSTMKYWSTKKVQDITGFAPDSKGYLSGLQADMGLSSVALQYGMHPLMVSCWTCLIGNVVSDYGEAAATNFLRDDNPQAQAVLKKHFEKYGCLLPPSIAALMTCSGMKKLKKMKKRPGKSSNGAVGRLAGRRPTWKLYNWKHSHRKTR